MGVLEQDMDDAWNLHEHMLDQVCAGLGAWLGGGPRAPGAM